MTDVVGNPEEERHAEFFFEPWSQEAVCRYFYGKVRQHNFDKKSFCSKWSLNNLFDCFQYICVSSFLQVQQRRAELEQALGIRNT